MAALPKIKWYVHTTLRSDDTSHGVSRTFIVESTNLEGAIQLVMREAKADGYSPSMVTLEEVGKK